MKEKKHWLKGYGSYHCISEAGTVASWKGLHQPHREAALRLGNRIERSVTVSYCPGETVVEEAHLLTPVH